MNIKEKLQLRVLINLLITIINSISKLFNQEKCNPDGCPIKPDDSPRPLKRVIDLLPWRNKK